jgi:ketosteroid isomerase-like protein
MASTMGGAQPDLKKIVADAYEARTRGDVDGTMQYFAEDCSFHIAGSPALGSMCQKIHGSAALRPLMEALITRWDFSGLRTTDMWVDGNTVIARRSGPIRDVATGDVSDTTFVDLISFHNGRIAAFEEFVDTHLIAGLLARNSAGMMSA